MSAMKQTAATLLVMALGYVVHVTAREEVVRAIDWKVLAASRALTSGVVVSAPGGKTSNLRLAHKEAGEGRFHLVTIERPPITSARYAVRGRVTYEKVAPGSYLEMWSHIGGGAYFSRTLGDGGPMGQLSGSSSWREFILPFQNREGGPPPEKLVINLVLRGGGTVEIGPLELVQYGSEENIAGDASRWWSERHAGLFGGVLGSTLGILGAVIGALGSAGRAKRFVLGSLKALAVLGLVGLGAGVVALTVRQPYAVYYPLLLIGAISGVVGLALPRVLVKRYEEFELRRIQALDA